MRLQEPETRAKAGTTPAEASVQPCTSHRLHIEELTETGESMENLIPLEGAQGSTKISVSDFKGQPTEVNQDSIGQPETSLASSQGFIVSCESSNSSQEPPNDSTVSPAQTTTVTSSMVREVQFNLNAPIQVDKLTNFRKYSESPSLAGPLTSASCTSESSSIPAPISQSLISQQLAFKGPDLCSTPKSDNSSKQMENKSLPSGDSLALNMPSTVYSGYSTINTAFSPVFSNEPDNVFGGKSPGFLDMPGQSQESESDKGTSGIGFSLFGDSASQEEENSNFFSFDFGGSSTHTEDRGSTSRGVFSLFGSDSADNSEDSSSGANFRLF
ncbi:uncharacterized protein LOC135219579 isoform X3 [Macrobrachium nipponense]|uniref:uncharacterized protein LOC135219579 isoform X3 n=1 Tax=Macrobrachium nipponense TaxID=159736 RepID=UPI0030C827BE